MNRIVLEPESSRPRRCCTGSPGVGPSLVSQQDQFDIKRFSGCHRRHPHRRLLARAALQKYPRLWRPVGPVDNFKMDEITEVSFEDTSALPWAGETSKTAAWLHRARRTSSSSLIPPTAVIWDVRCGGKRKRNCSCARVTAESITRTDRLPQDPRQED